MTDQIPNFSHFEDGADIADHGVEARSYPQIQLMNANATLHRGNIIQDGGFSIKDDAGQAPEAFGARENVKHLNGKSTDMRSAKLMRAAVIGWSPKHYVVTWKGFDELGNEKEINDVQSVWPRAEDLPASDAKVRARLSLFVVLECDPTMTVYEVAVRGFAVDAAIRVTTKINNLKRQAEGLLATQLGRMMRILPFGFWIDIGVAKPRLVGKTEQSDINDPVILTEAITLEDFVGPDQYAAFLTARRELDDYLATGSRGVPQMQTPKAPQLAAAPSAAQISAPAA